MSEIALFKGTTRLVIAVGDKVVKIAKNRRGIAANNFEFQLWESSSERRRAMLCPALAIFCDGQYLVARRAEPISEAEYDRLWDARQLPNWEYMPPDDVGDPAECKAADWGRIGGRLVRVDYANVPAVFDVENE